MTNAYGTQDVVTVHVQAAMAVLERTQKHLAAALQMHPSGVTHRFSGRIAWSSHELDALANYFGSSVTDLITDSPAFLQRAAEAAFERRSAARQEAHGRSLISAGADATDGKQPGRRRLGGALVALPLPRTSFIPVAA